jgi:putative ABC transport system permease protein
VVAALAIAWGAALAGSAQAVRRVIRLPPAEAMQPEPPPTYRRTLVERLGLGRVLSQPGRMILRNLERRPTRALLSIVAMSLAVAILVVGSAEADAIAQLEAVQFGAAQREDVTVSFLEPRGPGARQELARLAGVMRVEPFRALPATLRAGRLTRDVAVLGLQPSATLRRVVDVDGRAAQIPPDGLLLGRRLGALLHVARGDLVTIEVKEGRRPRLRAPVAGFVDEMLGLGAYLDLAALGRLMHEAGVTSGAYLAVDPRAEDALYARLKATPGIAGISVTRMAKLSLDRTLAESMGAMRVVLVVFAAIIAFGVVYNGARISLAERSRELASLRVIGLRRAETSTILLGELAVLTLMSVPVGCALGFGLMQALVRAVPTDLMRLPAVVHPFSYAYATVVLVVASTLSALLVRRKLDRLDLVEVLKTRE